LIFQDPTSSFDPRMSVGASIAEPLLVHGMTDRSRRRVIVEDLLERVGLSPDDYDRYPHEFSGGQKQRLALARALVLDPDLLVADEPVSALDVSIQADILALIDDLRTEFGLSILFISHDISVVRELCDRTAVMYLGELVELGPTEAVFETPQHPYTEALLSAVPTPDPRSRGDHIELTGSVPSPTDPPAGCRFHTRCHRVVQPEGIDLDQAVWRRVLDFRERVLAGEIDAASVRERLQAGGEPATQAGRGADPEPVADGPAADDAGRVRAAHNLPETLSDADAERALADAIDALLAGDDDRASEIVATEFTTPCAEIDPEFTTHGSDHEAACIRHRPEYGGLGGDE
jgi:peptide/nickel transport system ATP-binding protein